MATGNFKEVVEQPVECLKEMCESGLWDFKILGIGWTPIPLE